MRFKKINLQNKYFINKYLYYYKRGCRCQIQYEDGTTEWVPGQKVDPKLLDEYKSNQNKRSHPRVRFNATTIITVIIFLLNLMLKVSLAQKIESEFKYCQSKEISRIASPFLNCNHPNEINHQREKAHIDLKIEFPSNIYILSRNKFFANQIGYQCYKTRIITRSSWRYMVFRTRDVKKETIKMSRLECLMMAESKKCNDNPMSCTDEGCSYTPAQVDEYTWFYDQKSESFECTMRKRKITSEKPDTQLFASASSSCKYNDLYCNLFDSVVAWENTTTNECLISKIHYGTNYTIAIAKTEEIWERKNIIYSAKDALSFQITGTINECGVRLHKTTDDLLILFENDKQAKDHQHIEVATDRTTFNRHSDNTTSIISSSRKTTLKDIIIGNNNKKESI